MVYDEKKNRRVSKFYPFRAELRLHSLWERRKEWERGRFGEKSGSPATFPPRHFYFTLLVFSPLTKMPARGVITPYET